MLTDKQKHALECRLYRKRHPERAYASHKKWLAKNREWNLAYRRNYAAKHREKIAEQNKKYRSTRIATDEQRLAANRRSNEFVRQIKIEMIEAYGGKCVCCTETKREFLSLDHIHGGGNQERRAGGRMGAHLYRYLKRMGWPKDKFRLLCMNCNFALGRYGYCPHGGLT